jgi:tRNA threonylcarbamoyladenosine biosynthesis protein TsaB
VVFVVFVVKNPFMLLGLDTTTEFLHLALVDGDGVWTRRELAGIGRSHSEVLVPSLDALLKGAGATPKSLSGVACCVGPGGFTSLRIGVATAEGLALTGLPTWGFTAFALRRAALREAGVAGHVTILLDGQRGEAFLQSWDGVEPLAEARKAPLGDLGVTGPWWAPEAFAPKVALPERVTLPDEGEAMLKGLVALTRACAERASEAPLRPFYLRRTDAEVNFPEAAAHLPMALREGDHR